MASKTWGHAGQLTIIDRTIKKLTKFSSQYETNNKINQSYICYFEVILNAFFLISYVPIIIPSLLRARGKYKSIRPTARELASLLVG